MKYSMTLKKQTVTELDKYCDCGKKATGKSVFCAKCKKRIIKNNNKILGIKP